MCGRTACTRAAGEIADACTYQSKGSNISRPQWKSVGNCTYKPSYNNGPKSCSPILLKNSVLAGENEELSERILLPMQWGLIPSWHKGNPKDFSFNMINCRCETISEKKLFAKALEKGQRCIVLADGFYEWHSASGGAKQPYYLQFKESLTPHIREDGNKSKQLLTMAGLYDKQISEEEGELYTYTIITVSSSSSLNWLHHRMPAILETESSIDQWLDVKKVPWKEALDLLVPTNSLTWYPVSTVVNNTRNDTSDCIKKIDLAKEIAKKNASGNLMSAWLKKGEKRKESGIEEASKKPKHEKHL